MYISKAKQTLERLELIHGNMSSWNTRLLTEEEVLVERPTENVWVTANDRFMIYDAALGQVRLPTDKDKDAAKVATKKS